jgi:hypothetical protein
MKVMLMKSKKLLLLLLLPLLLPPLLPPLLFLKGSSFPATPASLSFSRFITPCKID